ncbi:hypothetical protein IVB34_37595 [Bradyrhizobium sp. 2]|uniref:hypothetical protein n=1 Tax=Bradyrhizobium sp. 2 TaxID=190045 RepID=UPI001FFB37C1|nr:hypothetical protein [Bradyrhizobium sp. 2]MCK1463915.1 hypothetical protein [Bradyrhizobium sp. 2]
MRKSWILSLLYFLAVPQMAEAQNADCNQLARDLVAKNYSAGSSDYYKLLFLSSLTQMSEESGKEALSHSGKVSVGPISIGPGTWNKDSQKELRNKLEKIVNIEQVRQSAASISMSSGDPRVVDAVRVCLTSAGGLYLLLNDRGKDTAVLQMVWTAYPMNKDAKPPQIEDVTIVHGKIIGGQAFAQRGAELEEKLPQRITIARDDPKQDLTVVVNLQKAGSQEAYVPPSQLPDRPPPRIVQSLVRGKPADVGSGAQYDGYRNPGCQAHEGAVCVQPQNGGKILPGTGQVAVTNKSGRAGFKDPIENSQQFCATFWANTGACQTPVFIQGSVTAVEEYTVQDDD